MKSELTLNWTGKCVPQRLLGEPEFIRGGDGRESPGWGAQSSMYLLFVDLSSPVCHWSFLLDQSSICWV